jgi:hypothetical protein
MATDNFFSVEIRNRLLTPAEAEVWITVTAQDLLADIELSGRLLGPRCVYASTVEVAYPLRPLPRQLESRGAMARVLIPEPSFWDPESPFLYQGPVTFWSGRKRWLECEVSHGLRHCQLGPRGLRWNGRAFTLRGMPRQQLSKEEARRLRQAGCNALFTTVGQDVEELWELWAAADRYGFLMLGRLADEQAVRTALALKGHPSCLGWLLSEALLQDEARPSPDLLQLHTTHGHLLGAEVSAAPQEGQLRGLQFVACPAGLLPDLEGLHWPKVVLSAEHAWSGDAPEVFGNIHGV